MNPQLPPSLEERLQGVWDNFLFMTLDVGGVFRNENREWLPPEIEAARRATMSLSAQGITVAIVTKGMYAEDTQPFFDILQANYQGNARPFAVCEGGAVIYRAGEAPYELATSTGKQLVNRVLTAFLTKEALIPQPLVDWIPSPRALASVVFSNPSSTRHYTRDELSAMARELEHNLSKEFGDETFRAYLKTEVNAGSQRVYIMSAAIEYIESGQTPASVVRLPNTKRNATHIFLRHTLNLPSGLEGNFAHMADEIPRAQDERTMLPGSLFAVDVDLKQTSPPSWQIDREHNVPVYHAPGPEAAFREIAQRLGAMPPGSRPALP